MSAAIAAEEAARVGADLALQAQIDANSVALLDLDGRVSVLEALHLTRSITWEETTDFDVVDLAGAIAGLNYQPGEWVFVVSRNAQTGREFGNCTNQPQVGDWLNAAASATTYDSGYINPTGSYFFINGSWYSSAPFQIYTYSAPTYQYMQVRYWYSNVWRHFVADRKGETLYITAEIYSFYSYGGLYLGNTLTINVDTDRLGACGF